MGGYRQLREQVLEANLELHRRGLVLYTFGNVSQVDRDRGVVAIKPSGVSYEELSASDIVVVDLENQVVKGKLRPSSDTRTHTYLYRHFPGIGGVTHTHSTHATAWAQARAAIPCLGTTHADYCYGQIPCTEVISDAQIERDYEAETGAQIAAAFAARDAAAVPMVLVAGHGPFTWGRDAAQAVYHAVVLEELARMAWLTRAIDPGVGPINQAILDKHYQRKHGADAYYGQPGH
ncbi:MAG: L-ribulose-5-phosphate 4-epimerase AraD [Gemmatimonadota bacterium]